MPLTRAKKKKLGVRRKAPVLQDLDTLDVQELPIDDVQPHLKNAREHDEENLRAIMTSLRAFGQRSPIVISTRTAEPNIVKGNGTWESAKRLGWKTIKVVQHPFASEAEEISYMLADNKTNDLSKFNYTGLTANLRELQEFAYDLDTTGFREFETRPLLGAEAWTPTDPGEAPTVVQKFKLVFNEEEWDRVEKTVRIARRRMKRAGLGGDELTDPEIVLWIFSQFRKQND